MSFLFGPADPVHIVSIFYEFVFYVGDYPFNPAGTPTWVFANGDTSTSSILPAHLSTLG